MECMEAALKSRYKKDMAMKFNPQTLFTDENVASCEDFVVDDLLDFSHEEALVKEKEEEPQQQKLQNHVSASVSTQHENQSNEIWNLSFNTHFDSVLTSELTVPAETEMKCVEAALKSSYKKDVDMKFSPQTLFSDENVASCEDFIVDDLLDFSHEEALVEEEEPQQQKLQNHVTASVSLQHENQSNETFNVSFNTHIDSVLTSELTVPDEDAANLEWLSHFVEDSFSEYPKENLAQKAPEPGRPGSTEPLFKTPVPVMARSKRTRTGVRVWLHRCASLTESSSTSSSTTNTTSSGSVTQNFEKNVKRKIKPDGEGCGRAPRRCSHCGVQKTPQWRIGPLGPKTLCNACGVRYKSGRLLPEYRPACSPTFSSELHSNHHRKVLEMRRKKE